MTPTTNDNSNLKDTLPLLSKTTWKGLICRVCSYDFPIEPMKEISQGETNPYRVPIMCQARC